MKNGMKKKKRKKNAGVREGRNVSLARIIPVIEVPLHFRTRIAADPRLNAPWEGVADGASGYHSNAASTAPTLRNLGLFRRGSSPLPLAVVVVTDGGAERREQPKGDGNRPAGTVTVGASPFDATPTVRASLRGDRKEPSQAEYRRDPEK
jgi:hypothetical protein